LLRGQ